MMIPICGDSFQMLQFIAGWLVHAEKTPLVCHYALESLEKWNMKNEILERICKGDCLRAGLDFRKRIHHCPVAARSLKYLYNSFRAAEKRSRDWFYGAECISQVISRHADIWHWLSPRRTYSAAKQTRPPAALAAADSPLDSHTLKRDNAICAPRREHKHTHNSIFGLSNAEETLGGRRVWMEFLWNINTKGGCLATRPALANRQKSNI